MRVSIKNTKNPVKNFFHIIAGIILSGLLLSSCLSLKMTFHLPKQKGASGTLELEYRFGKTLQNISNYPAPDNDIAPMPLPLWEWDFRGIAAQSSSIELLDYSFSPAKEGYKKNTGIVRAKLSFSSEEDLQLLLGREIRWQGQLFRWKLSADRVESPDKSYPQLDTNLSAQEKQLLQHLFTDQNLEIIIKGMGEKKIQRLAMADFLTGAQDINLILNKQ